MEDKSALRFPVYIKCYREDRNKYIIVVQENPIVRSWHYGSINDISIPAEWGKEFNIMTLKEYVQNLKMYGHNPKILSQEEINELLLEAL